MHPVEAYLTTIREIRQTGGGTAEESYYGALETLLNELGKGLKPRVRCVQQLQNTGAGEPDFGLFTGSQFLRSSDREPISGQAPERGVVEAKGWTEDVAGVAQSPQVGKYCDKYGLVLVTNYRDFLLVARENGARGVRLESFQLADSTESFLGMLQHPRKAAAERGERLLEFLRRVLLQTAPLTDPQTLAWFLASYAREAQARVEEQAGAAGLELLKQSLEEALGMKFEGEKGGHFFRATLVQTLFYGVFSAWVLWAGNGRPRRDQFNWKDAEWWLHVPMIDALFEQISKPSKLRLLHLVEVLDWAGAALNRVDREAFFKRFEEKHAVQYFYEPFLKEYDPELRKQLGVWYTPPEIVQYQVERVDRVLREELGIADGLADENVVVLDPCCGTGAYLVETLRRIHATLREKAANGLLARKVKKAAMERVFGFEILPAPFVVSHLQLGLMLRHLGAPLDLEKGERAGVYLTNALTGWEPLAKPKIDLPLLAELLVERDAADKVKRKEPILVIMGNPPYDGFAGAAMEEERDLTVAYRTTKRAPAPQGQGLNDLYIRFYRMAERRIVEKTGKGIVCFISNYSWLDGLSHTGMREHYLEVFDDIWIDCLNGDKYKTGKLTPWGEPDPSMFSTELNPEGIQVGTAVSLLLCRAREKKAVGAASGHSAVRFRHLWGKGKLAQLARNALGEEQAEWESIQPRVEIGYTMVPAHVDGNYLSWPLLPELFPVSFPGVKTSRDEFLVDIDRPALEKRIRDYLNPKLSHEEIAHRWPAVMRNAARYNPHEVRDFLLKRKDRKGVIVRYAYRPFDVRWLYWEPETKLLDEKRSEYLPYVFDGNVCLVSQQKPRRDWSRPQFIAAIGCLDLFDRGATCFPLMAEKGSGQVQPHGVKANLSATAQAYCDILDAPAEAVLHHAIAVMHAPTYAAENGGGLRQNWPRIPLPAKKSLLVKSVELGRRVAALLDTEHPLPGVTTGHLSPLLREVGVIRRVGGGQLDPAQRHLDLTAGWGHKGKGDVCMPGKGKYALRPQVKEELRKAFGDETLDIYLNEFAYWSNVPVAVWDYHLGGYQVIKKWLSYREQSVLGRALTDDEAEYVTEMARRIAVLVLLQPELDANYAAVKADPWPWPE